MANKFNNTRMLDSKLEKIKIKRYKYLVSLLPGTEHDMEDKYWDLFESEVYWKGTQQYLWREMEATSVRELFLLVVLKLEGIPLKSGVGI